MARDYEISGSYVPYILDMIREIIISDEEDLVKLVLIANY
jgi:hypothetical protein